jgi:hypothetical protein
MAYETILTTLGLAKIADAIANDTPLNLSEMQVGDGNGNPTTPSVSDTALVREVFTGTPSRIDVDSQDETRIVCELVIPASDGGFTIREVGIFDSDGDMIAIAQFPEIYKPDASEGATLDLVIRVYMAVSNTEAITLEVDTSVVIATRSWVVDQLDALIPGGTTDQILAKVSNADGDYEWRDADDVNVVVDVIQEVQTLSAAQTIVDLVTATTVNAAVYIQGVRLLPTQWTATTSTRITLATGATAGHKIHVVQNDPNGEASFLSSPQNLADVPDKSAARANLELLTSTTYLDALWKLMNQRQYPVGEIYVTRRSGNPSSLLGFGTWEAYAQGRVLVGYDSADSSFDAQDKTGGAKVHHLSLNEIPAHTHSNIVALSTTNDFDTTGGSSSGVRKLTSQTGSAGGGQAHNNLQPYITVFMWKRTA